MIKPIQNLNTIEQQRVKDIIQIIDRYSKYLFKETKPTQENDELQGMITILLNELSEILGIPETEYLTLIEYVPIPGITPTNYKTVNGITMPHKVKKLK